MRTDLKISVTANAASIRYAQDMRRAKANRLNVLIVDDNDDDALLAAEALCDAGYDPTWARVDTATSLDAALQGQRWDVVLCDARMPVLTMPVALSLLRRGAPATPVVLVAGQRPDDTEEMLASEALKGVLEKDRLHDLAALVCGLLS
jgi:CheY-like chemotaxis protein